MWIVTILPAVISFALVDANPRPGNTLTHRSGKLRLCVGMRTPCTAPTAWTFRLVKLAP
jgi:hypothetical protein